MKNSLIVWGLSFAITAASAYYQRVTGPTYPLSGTAMLGPVQIPYRLERSHAGNSDAPVALIVPDTSVSGALDWRRHNTDDSWKSVGLKREEDSLCGALPAQPPAGKLQYRVALRRGADSLLIPAVAPAVIRFKGDVPPGVLVVHVLLMFAAMLFSTRTGLTAYWGGENLGRLSVVTTGLLIVGGLVLGPVVQRYAFGAYWTGWPFGTDLTDNKTVAALLAWTVVALVHRKVRRPTLWALGAALITLAVFMIPHSLFGSELDYRSASGSVSLSSRMDADKCAPDGGRHD